MIILNASDTAAAAGLNRYKSPEEIASKHTRTEAQRLIESTVTKDELRQLVSEVSGNHGGSVPKVEEVVLTKAKKNAEQAVQKAKQELKQAVTPEAVAEAKSNLVQAQKKAVKPSFRMLQQLKKELTSVSNKQMGTVHETSATDMYEQDFGEVVTNRNDRRYTMHLNTENGHEFEIRGYIDGLTGGGKVLFEAKNRQRHLFWKIPLYEKVQLEVYMRMLDLEQAILFQRNPSTQESGRLSYTKDDTLWKKVLDGLNAYGNNFFSKAT